MPWKECQKMDEKLRFVSRHLEGESISQLCREFGISRVTGHNSGLTSFLWLVALSLVPSLLCACSFLSFFLNK
jgi:lysophospholipid acyltransferase (LPLAT)-like uncharacterized protein